MTATRHEVPHSWPVALHPDARPVARAANVVDVGLDGRATRIVSDKPGLPWLVNRLLRERPLGEFLAENRRRGFADGESAAVLARLGQAGALRRLVDPGALAPDVRRDFEREIGALARFETASLSRFDLFARVRSAHVLLVGAGILGAHIAQFLACAGVGRITLVDSEPIAPHHAGRHPWWRHGSDVGRPKAVVTAERVAETTPHTATDAHVGEIATQQELDALLDGIAPLDVCVYTIDRRNMDFGAWVARLAARHGFAVLRANRFVIGPFYVPGRDHACPGCIAPRLTRQISDLPRVLALGAQGRDETVFLPTLQVGLFGAFAAEEVVRHLTGAQPIRTFDRQIAPDFAGEPTVKPFPREADCSACGTLEPRKGGEA